MKKIKSILDAKLLLAIAFVGFSALGFSQTTDANIADAALSKEVIYDFMGTDLSSQLPPQLNGWMNLSGNRQNPELKSAEFSHSRLDSIVGTTNYGQYAENWKWQFNYDNNKLTTSTCKFYDNLNSIRNKIELRTYDENGQTISVVITERNYQNEAYITSYKEDNEYVNGNLAKQVKFEVSGMTNWVTVDMQSGKTTVVVFNYNEKNQLTKMTDATKGINNYRVMKEYFYDQTYRKEYLLDFITNTLFRVYKYEYTTSDSTMLIKEKFSANIAYKTPIDLEKIKIFDSRTYQINFDEQGRTKSIENTYTFDKSIIFKVEYDYTPSGKQRQATYYLPIDPYDPASYYAETIIKNTYDEQDNLLQYEKMFYNSVTHEWVDEELQTYYYSSIKSVSTSYDQHKTDDFQIYPNPASEVIYLSASPEPGTSYAIYNSMGVVVSQGLFKSPSIQVSQLKPGIYFLKTIGTNAVSSFRFIKN